MDNYGGEYIGLTFFEESTYFWKIPWKMYFHLKNILLSFRQHYPFPPKTRYDCVEPHHSRFVDSKSFTSNNLDNASKSRQNFAIEMESAFL